VDGAIPSSEVVAMTKAEQLIADLDDAFGYTRDNNRDLLTDETFPMADVVEELKVEEAYQFLQAYISRNSEMINLNMAR
jgi:hypothetical protein